MYRMVWAIVLMTCLGYAADERSARQAYLSKQYTVAKSLYSDLVQAQPYNTAYWYNMGASYFRLGDLVMAKQSFLRTLAIDPGHSDAQHNIHVINAAFIDQDLFFNQHFTAIMGLNRSAWRMVMVLVALPVLALVGAMYRFQNLRWLKRPVVAFGGIWLAIVMGIILWRDPEYGIVNRDRVMIYSGPSQTQNGLFYAHKGAEFRIIKASDRWVYIQFANGLTGWLQTEGIQWV
jgi:tetratricopeptide (TPR) repeat protein